MCSVLCHDNLAQKSTTDFFAAQIEGFGFEFTDERTDDGRITNLDMEASIYALQLYAIGGSVGAFGNLGSFFVTFKGAVTSTGYSR